MKRSLTLAISLSLGAAVLFGMPCARAQSTVKPFFMFSCSATTKVCPQGEDPSSLMQSADGNFYGTAEFGGSGNKAAGTVFKLTPAGKLSVIHTFVADSNGNFPTGANPTNLVEGNDGFLYGTTLNGGANAFGVVFRMSKTGVTHVLHSFCSLANCADGDQPFTLVLGSNGNFYGCTTNSFPPTLFRLTTSGTYTLLHTFNFSVDGSQCVGIISASDGNIYGSTAGGLSFPTILFGMTPAGQMSTLHNWRYPQFPFSSITQTSDGRIWGVLTGVHVGSGGPGMFGIDLSGNGYQEVLLPYPRPDSVRFITQASDGNFWGTVGNEIVSFTLGGESLQQIQITGTSGSAPISLLQASDGRLLGLTNNFGTTGSDPGEIFTIEPALGAPKPEFVTFSPASGKAGSQVMIRGTHFVGTTAVKFNGVSAAFHVLNTGTILTTVPTGATTGPITVVNKGGQANSTTHYTVE